MSGQFEQVEISLKKNVQDVQGLMEFDRVILDFSISALKELQKNLAKHQIENPALLAANTLRVLQDVRKNDSLRPRYQVIFNQCIVLLVSVFASAVADLFRDGINALVRVGKSDEIRKEELQLTVGELEDMGYDLTDKLGHLIAEKNDISFQDMKSIRRAFHDYFGIEVPKDRIVNNIILAQAARHIIVHDAGKINERFLKQVSSAIPRDIKTVLTASETIQFDTNEITLVTESMLTYFTSLRNKVEQRLQK